MTEETFIALASTPLQISANYLAGIKEGRSVRKLIDSTSVEQVARTELAFCERVGYWAGSAPSAEFVRGLRDFWLNQLTKA